MREPGALKRGVPKLGLRRKLGVITVPSLPRIVAVGMLLVPMKLFVTKESGFVSGLINWTCVAVPEYICIPRARL